MQNFSDGKVPVADNKAMSLYNLALAELSALYKDSELENISYWLLEHFTQITKQKLTQEPTILVNQSSIIHFSNALDKLKKGMPIQYVIGEVAFYHLRFKVNSAVLIPRPETEELVDLIVKENIKREGLKILDIGTGSGCIAISIAKHLIGSQVTALDMSAEALHLARENAVLNQVSNIEFLEADFISENYFVEKEFDVIISNPPYIAESEKLSLDKNVVDFEPNMALFVPDHDVLIFYRTIAAMAQTHLKSEGTVYLEVNEKLGEETAEIFANDPFSSVILLQDMFKKNRFIKAERR